VCVLPSHKFTRIPASLGLARQTGTSRICSALNRLRRCPSCRPAKPFCSRRRTQYSTLRGASLAFGLILKPEAREHLLAFLRSL
jgi:hypothetical protein